jgi:hypothetical protein
LVKGLDFFKAHFEGFEDQYLLIGGAACDLALANVNLTFRATKDLDIVLALEELRPEFVRRFWDFVRLGGYQARERESGRHQYYRFSKPEDGSYPSMLELFSRVPDSLRITGLGGLTPIPVEEGVRSLSAILLNDGYYKFLKSGRILIAGLPIVGPEYLIALKAKAWLDLVKRKQNGEPIDGRNITKHKNDIFRLFPLIRPTLVAVAPLEIKEDMETFLVELAKETVDLPALGIKGISLPSALANLRRLYSI